MGVGVALTKAAGRKKGRGEGSVSAGDRKVVQNLRRDVGEVMRSCDHVPNSFMAGLGIPALAPTPLGFERIPH